MRMLRTTVYVPPFIHGASAPSVGSSALESILALLPYFARLRSDERVRIAGIEKVPPRLAPDIGQHSKAILAEFGFGDEIARLVDTGVVGA